MNNPQQGPTQFSAPSRTALPIQPTAASSSSGKHTPQIPRMPVYLPANHGRSQRPDEGQTGQSESDTDHGTLVCRYFFLLLVDLLNFERAESRKKFPKGYRVA
jgi:hypothetical protein